MGVIQPEVSVHRGAANVTLTEDVPDSLVRFDAREPDHLPHLSPDEKEVMAASAREALGPHTPDDITRYYDRGAWQHEVLSQIVARHARERAGQVFVSDGDTSFTYAQLHEQAIRLATGLRGLGVGRGDRVAVQMPNWAEFAVVVTAISRLGAVLVPIMPIFRYDEVQFMLEHSGAVVSVSPEFFHKFDYREMYRDVRAATAAVRHSVIVRGDRPDGEHESSLESLYAEGDLAELDAALGDPAGADDPCLVVYTSGTTSRPKGCLHTFNTLHASAFAMIGRLGITDADVFFNPSPVAHSTGLVTGLLMPLLAGAATHFQPSWDPEDGLRRIAEYRCTVTYTATTFITTLMQAYVPEQHDMGSMRFWVCAGAPIPGAVVQAARSRFPGCSVLSLYGRSENMTTTMNGPADPPERSVTSDGHALPDAEVVVVDPESGAILPAGDEGDVAYYGPSHMLGYYADPEQTAALYTPDGFSRSGDLGIMDADGFVRVSGRVKDIIIRGGLNISSREVEDLLSGHDAVRAVAVVAMPDPRLGEKSCAFVVLAPGAELTLADISAYLQEQKVAVQKHPERLEIVESLPMTAVGKVRKNVLRDEIAAMLAAERGETVRS
jgi:acyl-coenzyme A synthetase/AMP-(fatty) acid ligase